MGSAASSGSGGETQWVQTVEGTGWSSSVTVDQDGFIYLISLTGPYLVPPHIPLVLNKYSPSGELLSSRIFETPGTPIAVGYHSFAVSSLGSIFLGYTVNCEDHDCTPGDLGGGPIRGNVLVKLDADGNFVWQRRPPGDFAGMVFTDSSGNPLTSSSGYMGGDGALSKYSDDGTLLWSRTLDHGLLLLATDPGDNMVLAGAQYPQGPTFLKTDPDGTVLWRQALTGATGGVSAVAIADDGTLLVTGYFYGSFTWAGTALNYSGNRFFGGFLLAADSKGTPLWGQQFDGSVDITYGAPEVEVSSLDQIAVAFSYARPACFNSTVVSGYDLSGQQLWFRIFSPDCSDTNFVVPQSLAIDANGRVSVSGRFAGTIDFGTGDITAQQYTDIFLVNLAY
jgi:hypothetical protein